MTLAQIAPKVASFPELHTFRCHACGDVRTVEQIRDKLRGGLIRSPLSKLNTMDVEVRSRPQDASRRPALNPPQCSRFYTHSDDPFRPHRSCRAFTCGDPDSQKAQRAEYWRGYVAWLVVSGNVACVTFSNFRDDLVPSDWVDHVHHCCQATFSISLFHQTLFLETKTDLWPHP